MWETEGKNEGKVREIEGKRRVRGKEETEGQNEED